MNAIQGDKCYALVFLVVVLLKVYTVGGNLDLLRWPLASTFLTLSINIYIYIFTVNATDYFL